MLRQSVIFTQPYRVEVRDEECPAIGKDQVLVKTRISAISPGTELLVYRGEAPAGLAADETIPALQGDLGFPLKYGYASVGEVCEAGPGAGHHWVGKRVFSFQPHQSYFVAATDQVMLIPEAISDEDAVFLPNMETALNLVMDGAPLIGERVVVLGQGVVGLLVTALLAQFPLGGLVTSDCYQNRQAASLHLGAQASYAPDLDDIVPRLRGRRGADLVYEVTGDPRALDLAIQVTGFAGRVIVGSWYGKKQAPVNLGGYFHRNRIQLISSQVSTIAPELSGRWNKNRRFELAWEMIKKVHPTELITLRQPIRQADAAYQALCNSPDRHIQPIFLYA